MNKYLDLVNEEWLYEKEMEVVIGLIFQVRNALGAGRSEEIYHRALVKALTKAGIPTQSKPRRALIHRGVEIHVFEPDIIVWDKIILELKVLLNYKKREFPLVNQAQILRYLKFYGFELGALINFAHSKVGIRRMIFEESPVEFEEKYERMMPHVNEADKAILRQVLTQIKRLARQYGLGYPETLYRKLIAVEMTHQGISCVSDIHVPATFEGEEIGTQATPFILIEDRFLLHVRALMDGTTTYDFLTTRTFLAELGLKVGWVVNYGRNKVHIQATAVKN